MMRTNGMSVSAPAPAKIPRSEADTFREGLVEAIPALRAFARSLCRKRDVADDLVQETMMKGWQSRERFQPGTNLKAWLFAILRNEFYSSYRRAKTVANYAAMESTKPEGVDADQYAKLELTDLMRAFDELAPEQREALILTVGEFSYEEAAAICGCAVGTIKSRISRARKQLEQLVDGKGGKLADRVQGQEDAADVFLRKLNRPPTDEPLR
jgi:RNA polymerase sigma-70 factor (ECF subfamily)